MVNLIVGEYLGAVTIVISILPRTKITTAMSGSGGGGNLWPRQSPEGKVVDDGGCEVHRRRLLLLLFFLKLIQRKSPPLGWRRRTRS
jgi:hypothetical protein